ncbi:uncharacterized protein LOC108207080 [Daucus carota subsp. sativus]|uniref:uncharacterized protein LOC108207080 n=1 Tax=Daucus carota subsp. sativus TaxID=79200 RepID=UPI0007EFAEC0|nr:PREDICTED: uncharacterized protein LOC108207080 [Daucus carota subsp. sativus]
MCCNFKATNNEAEYEALIMGLTITKDMKIKCINVSCDSLLIVNHVNGSYEAKDTKMLSYLDIVKQLRRSFDVFNIRQVPRELNVQADALAGLGVVFKDGCTHNVPVIHLLKPATVREQAHPSAQVLDVALSPNNKDDWMQTYKDYLQLGQQPANRNEAKMMRMKVSRFILIDDVLFKKSVSGLLQRCLDINEANMILRDLHEENAEITQEEETCHSKC